MQQKGSLTVISGFSGAGKGTIVRELLRRHEEYVISVSVTTRSPRAGERDGIDYHFLSQEDFDVLVREDGLLEYAGYVNHSYGTPRRFVEEQIALGRDVILEIEVQGARQIREKCPDAISLFILPPSVDELCRRLNARGTETQKEIQGRLCRAREEAKEMSSYDYLIVNDDLDEAVEAVHRTIQTAKRAPFRNSELIQKITLQLANLNE